MQIDEKGYILSSSEDIVKSIETELQKKFGSDYYIKPEGVMDNIACTVSSMVICLQDEIAKLAKEFDPETAENYWQDALYERIGIKRLEEEPTRFKKKIRGAAGYSGVAGSITLRSASSNDEFVNTSEYLIEDGGTVLVEFECIKFGVVNVSSDEIFTIVDAPNEVTDVLDEEASDIVIGRDAESDNDYRIRFRNSKSQNAKGTRKANIANLLPYVDDIAFLKIYDKNEDNTLPAGTLLIIAKHNTTDEIFAKAIFDTVVDGIDFAGDTTVVLKDTEGQDVPISWKNADEIPMDITGTIKIRSGYYPNTVMSNVKQGILEYIEKRVYGLESVIYATEFIVPMLETDGVEAVTSVEVKKTTDASYSDSVTLTREQVPVFALERITLNKHQERRKK